jgi:hypothetical protein
MVAFFKNGNYDSLKTFIIANDSFKRMLVWFSNTQYIFSKRKQIFSNNRSYSLLFWFFLGGVEIGSVPLIVLFAIWINIMITQKITAHDIIQVLAWDELKTLSELIRLCHS